MNLHCGVRNADLGLNQKSKSNFDWIKIEIPNRRRDMNQEEMKQRTKVFALGIIQLVESLPKERTTAVLGGQLLRSGTSVGSSYRSACRAKSIADFISKMGIVEEEADESLYWMELLIEAGIEVNVKMEALMKEAGELLAITVASIKTAKKRRTLSNKRT
jgi:four helix bundle protein